MNSRSLGVLAAVGLILLAAAYLATREPDAGALNAPLVPDLEDRLNEVTDIRVTGPGGQPVASLVRAEDGWQVSERGGYPADLGLIRKNLIALGSARIVEPKTANPEFYNRLGVEDLDSETATGLGLEIAANGESLSELIIGDTGVGGDYAYVRRVGEAESWMVSSALDLEEDTAGWLDRDLMNIPSDRIARVTIRHSDGEVVNIAGPTESSMDFQVLEIPEGRELDYPGVANAIGGALSTLQLDDVHPLPAQPETIAKTVTIFETVDGLTVTATSWETDDGTRVSFQGTYTAVPELDESGDVVEPGADDVSDPAAEAETISSRLAGWAYVLPGYKTDQFQRRMSDLLKTEDES